MSIFTIENETNNIMAHATLQAAEAVPNAERFRSEAALTKFAADWPAARLVEIFNSVPGVSPVKKFTDRKTATSRIWKAMQSLRHALPSINQAQPETTATLVAPQTGHVALPEAATTNQTSLAENAPRAATQAKGTREGSKTAAILALLKRAGGVSSKDLMEATGWQAHSVRGFLSGTIGKKMGLKLLSSKGENGERSYSISD